jgi:hypothetical protein
MTVEKAIEAIRQAGRIWPGDGCIRADVPKRLVSHLQEEIDTIRNHRKEALSLLSASGLPPEKLPPIVKGQAVCLYSDLVGENLWIAADEDDAQILVSQGERRGQIYTPKEVRLIIRSGDPEIVKQAHAFKSKLNARMRDDDQR